MTDRSMRSGKTIADSSREMTDHRGKPVGPHAAGREPSAREIADAIIRRVISEVTR